MTSKEIKRLIDYFQTFSLRDNALLMVRSRLYAYQFAALLDRMFNWKLERISNMTAGMGIAPCPLFLYYDESQKTLCFVMENPDHYHGSDSALGCYDKILLLCGDLATVEQQRLFRNLSLQCGDLVEEVDYLDFSMCLDQDFDSSFLTEIEYRPAKAKRPVYSKPGNKKDYEAEKAVGMQYSMFPEEKDIEVPPVRTSLFVGDATDIYDRQQRALQVQRLRIASTSLLEALQLERELL